MVRWTYTLFVSNFMLHFDTVAHIVTSNAQNNCCHWAIVLEPMGNKWHQQGHRDGFWRGGFSFTVFSLNSPSWFTLDHSHTDFIINQASTFMEYIKRMNNLVKSAADKVLNNFLSATISYCSSALITLLLVLPSPALSDRPRRSTKAISVEMQWSQILMSWWKLPSKSNPWDSLFNSQIL